MIGSPFGRLLADTLRGGPGNITQHHWYKKEMEIKTRYRECRLITPMGIPHHPLWHTE